MRRLIALLLGVLLAVAAAPPALIAADSAPSWPSLERDYRVHLLAARPDLAARYGYGGEDQLAAITEATLERDASWLERFTRSLASIDRARLARRQLAEFDSVSARATREQADLTSGLWSRDPDAYLALVPGAIFAVADQPHVSPCERTRRALHRLRASPEVLRSALVNLRAGATFDRDSVAAHWLRAIADMRTRLPGTAKGCHDSGREADLIEADTLAVRSASEFLDLLRAGDAHR